MALFPFPRPFLMIFFLNRLNFSRRIRKSGLKIGRKTLKVISRHPALRTTINVWQIPSSSVMTFSQGLVGFNCRDATGPPENGSRENFKEKETLSQTILKTEKSVQKKHMGKRVETFRTLKQDVEKMRGQIFPVHEVARTNFSTRFSNSSGNFKPFGKKNRRNPSIFSPEINNWSLVEKRVR